MSKWFETSCKYKLIVGLGNPGTEYRRTRHNIGYEVLDHVAADMGVSFAQEKYEGVIARFDLSGFRIILLKPMTFMNRSGLSVEAACRNRVTNLEHLLVILDDVHLPLGRIRIRKSGSHGGHNGLRNITERLGTDVYPRLRIGVGKDNSSGDLAQHVLSRFRPDEYEQIQTATKQAAQAVRTYIEEGLEKAMSTWNTNPLTATKSAHDREKP